MSPTGPPIEAAYLSVMKSYFNNDKKMADEVASNRITIFKKCLELSDENREVDVTKITENLKEIENFVCNIARIVLDKE